MEQIWNQVMERLSNPEVLFGLAVRFFGVFIVLIIVMIVLYLTGWIFQRIEEKEQEAASADDKGGPPHPTPTGTSAEAVGTSPGSDVPGEIAAAVALSMVPDEVAVAVALALNETAEERGLALRLSAQAGVPAAWEEPGTAWKLVGRQQSLSQKTSLSRDITPKGK
jgi:hypothetical protein